MKRKIIILFVVFILIAVVLVLMLFPEERKGEKQREVVTNISLEQFNIDEVYKSYIMVFIFLMILIQTKNMIYISLFPDMKDFIFRELERIFKRKILL